VQPCDESTCPYIHDHSRDNVYCETCEAIEIQNEAEYVVKALLKWAEQMGGWDAPIWERAKKLVALIDREPYTPPTIEED
jgi:hypothetical protein